MENHFTPVVIVFFGDFYRRFRRLTNGGIFTVQIALTEDLSNAMVQP
jgi:hypothetical protein